ncbi:phosphoribosylglycinamide formyltransferase [Brevibacterium luteolum]|uniref:phosphoribosylglycinamide formyltransferase n=1 Tax=Brevibacterium luteolum TaxID=199591 RepID=UPI0021AF2F19|nr:phosphoribosylglycinamide formyltransferase [Brevibacterium luteolum]MCT1873984.1 phosphoribosylglycinamide formyltransferase [Brevibacterium luteolum]MCT1891580.1 phosphoribosylglycinamide formyltransferase [Brevibacterium luteolum]MCT1893883.1 phosphoribosylglycinamide formyltransferase [Brevibacterium luteolum]MCT1924702.1 phosphoribosylglycinamide formyltransferase [Brevibacterium luteolum]
MRLVTLASGSGSLTQAVIDAFTTTAPVADVTLAAVGSDRPDAPVLDRARGAGLDAFVVAPRDFASRDEWNQSLAETVAGYEPDWVVSAGFMRILGPDFISRFPQRIINTHPALLPSFPGAHGVRDALAYGVKVTGSTVHLVDEGVDTGPIIAQQPVLIEPDDTEDTLHERIRQVERRLLVKLLTHLADGRLHIDGRHVTGFDARDSID